jgi:hypothetical protein
MKNYIYKIAFASVLAFFSSCAVDEFVPENSLTVELIVTSENDLLNLLVGTYSFAGSGASYGGQAYIASELIGNSNDLVWNGTFIDPDEYIRKQMVTTNGFVRNLFSDNYDAINQCNIILANLGVIESSVETRRRIEGEAKFIRALEHFDLVRFYATQYQPGGNNSQMGITLNLEPSTESIASGPRNSVEEVYTQVVTDLTDAISLLPSSNGFFADKATAQGLLARVYLQQGNYAGARDIANTVIGSSGHSLTASYDGAFNNDSNSSEDIFSFQVDVTDGNNAMNTFWATSQFGGRPGNPDIAITDAFYASLPAGDFRKTYFYTGNGGNATIKWQGEDTNVPFMRLAEMYLIRAEGNVRLATATGDTPLNDLNRLRNRVMAPTLSGAITLNDVLRDRRFELAFEGHLLHDVKRLGSMAGSLPSTSNRIIMPIPQAEIDANPEAVQNPGY